MAHTAAYDPHIRIILALQLRMPPKRTAETAGDRKPWCSNSVQKGRAGWPLH